MHDYLINIFEGVYSQSSNLYYNTYNEGYTPEYVAIVGTDPSNRPIITCSQTIIGSLFYFSTGVTTVFTFKNLIIQNCVVSTLKLIYLHRPTQNRDASQPSHHLAPHHTTSLSAQ